MKKLLALVLVAAFAGSAMAAESAPGNTRQVCLDVKDKAGQPVKNPDGTVKKSCKTVKAHQKHEGTKIEDAKK